MSLEIKKAAFKEFPEFESERLLFRKILPGDAKDIFLIRSNNEVMRFMDVPRHNSISDSEKLIHTVEESYKNETGINWAIIEKQSYGFIGYIGFIRIFPEHCRAEIGYALKHEYWGKGYMYEAINKLEELKDNAKLFESREKRLSHIAELLNNQIEDAKKDLALAEKNRQRSVKEATNEAKAMTLLMLDNEVQQQRQRLANLEERRIVEIAESQDKLTNELASNIRQQQAQQGKIARVEAQLVNLVETRSLVPPMRSMEPTGTGKRVILAIAMVLGFIVAVMTVFIAEFLQKAKEKMDQDESPVGQSSP